MSKFTAQQIEEAIEDAGWDVRAGYSGRFMYGKTCPSVEFDSMNSVIRLFIAIAESDAALAEELATSAKFDSLGKGYIVYWPRYTYADVAVVAV